MKSRNLPYNWNWNSFTVHGVEITEIYSHDLLTKISWNHLPQKVLELISRIILKIGKVVKNTITNFILENQQFFRQINVFTKEVTKEVISRKFLSVTALYRVLFPHCLESKLLSLLCQINYLLISVVKNVTFTKFLPKKCKSQFFEISTLLCLNEASKLISRKFYFSILWRDTLCPLPLLVLWKRFSRL